jgi:nucleotide-binding universal stress UspA family protein
MTSSVPHTRPALLCWDGSEAAARAMRGAATVLGEPRPALVVFVHLPATRSADAAGVPTVSDEAAQDVLATGVRIAREAGFDATGLRIASGDSPAGVISAAAEEHDARLLVLGQARRTAINRLLLGSVARDLLSAQHRPVVLVGSAERASPADAPGTRDGGSDGPVLICWDGSEGAARAIEDAAEIVGPGHRATVLFAHVPTESARGILGGLSGPDAPIMGHTDAELLIEQGLNAAREAGFEARALPVVAERQTAEIIAATAESEGSLLITMGQRERSAIGTLVLGSVARGVLEADHRPVLLAGPSHPGVYPRSRS